MKRVFLIESEAAELLRCTTGTLRNKRHLGGGPPFLKIGKRVLYDEDAVVQWARDHSRVSTSAPAEVVMVR